MSEFEYGLQDDGRVFMPDGKSFGSPGAFADHFIERSVMREGVDAEKAAKLERIIRTEVEGPGNDVLIQGLIQIDAVNRGRPFIAFNSTCTDRGISGFAQQASGEMHLGEGFELPDKSFLDFPDDHIAAVQLHEGHHLIDFEFGIYLERTANSFGAGLSQIVMGEGAGHSIQGVYAWARKRDGDDALWDMYAKHLKAVTDGIESYLHGLKRGAKPSLTDMFHAGMVQYAGAPSVRASYERAWVKWFCKQARENPDFLKTRRSFDEAIRPLFERHPRYREWLESEALNLEQALADLEHSKLFILIDREAAQELRDTLAGLALNEELAAILGQADYAAAGHLPFPERKQGYDTEVPPLFPYNKRGLGVQMEKQETPHERLSRALSENKNFSLDHGAAESPMLASLTKEDRAFRPAPSVGDDFAPGMA